MIIFCLISLLTLVAFAMYMTFKEQREVEEYCDKLSITDKQLRR
jgi:heme/copper-type cytochrome/quinol oxidase subunit 4